MLLDGTYRYQWDYTVHSHLLTSTQYNVQIYRKYQVHCKYIKLHFFIDIGQILEVSVKPCVVCDVWLRRLMCNMCVVHCTVYNVHCTEHIVIMRVNDTVLCNF